jgi:UDP-N-acetyl-D-mannosaminuronate dehydrogenase
MVETQLNNKIISPQALIGVIGLGYVGLPLVPRVAQKVFFLLGYDSGSQKAASFP